MEITTRSLWTLIHGIGFGALYLLACSGAIVALYRHQSTGSGESASPIGHRALNVYMAAMAVLGWLAVLTGTYIVYPWYRAAPSAGISSLAAYPRSFLLSNPATAQWHTVGMEWKEHIAWIVPIVITAAAVVAIQYGRDLVHHPRLRGALLNFVAVSLLAAGVAGFFGAMLDKNAPVEGGQTIQLVKGE
jgi:hypothetical protein